MLRDDHTMQDTGQLRRTRHVLGSPWPNTHTRADLCMAAARLQTTLSRLRGGPLPYFVAHALHKIRAPLSHSPPTKAVPRRIHLPLALATSPCRQRPCRMPGRHAPFSRRQGMHHAGTYFPSSNWERKQHREQVIPVSGYQPGSTGHLHAGPAQHQYRDAKTRHRQRAARTTSRFPHS